MKNLKNLKHIMILLLISVFFTACVSTQPVITKVVYRDKQCPAPKPKPNFTKYEVLMLKINGKEFYALQKSEAIKLITNWISYKSWAETNYNLMKTSIDVNISKQQ